MIKFHEYFDKIFRKNQRTNFNKVVEYNPQNIENIFKRFDELNEYIASLESSLKVAEKKTHAYEDILFKYEKLFKEEISLYRLHRSNVSVLNENYFENEIFIDEIQQQVDSFVNKKTPGNDNLQKSPPFKRLFSRFLHQNELHKTRTKQKLRELNETIEQKNRMLERMYNDIASWEKRMSPSTIVPQQALSVKQACG